MFPKWALALFASLVASSPLGAQHVAKGQESFEFLVRAAAGDVFDVHGGKLASVEEAALAYEGTLLGISTLSQEKYLRERECSFLGNREHRCIGYRYLPPFPVVLPYNAPEGYLVRTEFSWAPATEALLGEATLQEWKSLASEGSMFACGDIICQTIVFEKPEVKTREEILVLCEVFVGPEEPWIPRRCTPIAIISDDQAWIRIVAGYNTRRLLAKARDGGPYVVQIRGEATPTAPQVLDAAEQALSGPPLALSTKVRTTMVLGTQKYRVSPILKPYREIIRIQIMVFEELAETSRLIEAVADMTLYVNRYNTTRPSDWHMPDFLQLAQYEQAFEVSLKGSLESLCKSFKWADSTTLECNP